MSFPSRATATHTRACSAVPFDHCALHCLRIVSTALLSRCAPTCSLRLAKFVRMNVFLHIYRFSFPSGAKKTHTRVSLELVPFMPPAPPHVNVEPETPSRLTEVCVFFAPRNRPPGLDSNTEHRGRGVLTQTMPRWPLCVFFAPDGTPQRRQRVCQCTTQLATTRKHE